MPKQMQRSHSVNDDDIESGQLRITGDWIGLPPIQSVRHQEDLPESRSSRHQSLRKFEKGYPSLSAFMVSDPDKDGVIFRRFDRVSARNLLILETEVAILEDRLDKLESPETTGESDILQGVAQSWEILEEMALRYEAKFNPKPDPKPDPKSDRTSDPKLDPELAPKPDDRELLIAFKIHGTLLRLRAKLKEYHEALALYNQVISFGIPRRRALKASRRKLAGRWDLKAKNKTKVIQGVAGNRLDPDLQGDLCTLKTARRNPEPDRLTRLFEGKLAWMFRKKVNGNYEDYIRHSTVDTVVSAISSTLAVVFLVGAIFGLHYLRKDQISSLGLLIGLVVGFAISLAMLTNARRQDVFAITAAYAAVLVVFVSSE